MSWTQKNNSSSIYHQSCYNQIIGSPFSYFANLRSIIGREVNCKKNIEKRCEFNDIFYSSWNFISFHNNFSINHDKKMLLRSLTWLQETFCKTFFIKSRDEKAVYIKCCFFSIMDLPLKIFYILKVFTFWLENEIQYAIF